MRTPSTAILFVLLLAVSIAAQAKPAANVDIIPDVVYGHKDGMALTFDVFKPKTRPNGAAIIFIVSGGWVSRYIPPNEALSRYQELLDHGFTVIALRHGGSPKYLIPEIVADDWPGLGQWRSGCEGRFHERERPGGGCRSLFSAG